MMSLSCLIKLLTLCNCSTCEIFKISLTLCQLVRNVTVEISKDTEKALIKGLCIIKFESDFPLCEGNTFLITSVIHLSTRQVLVIKSKEFQSEVKF